MTFEKLWKISQQTIEELEQEIQAYHKQHSDDFVIQLKNRTAKTIKSLQSKNLEIIQLYRNERAERMSLEESKRMFEQRFSVLGSKYNGI